MPLRFSNPDEIRHLRKALLAASYNPTKINEQIHWPPGSTSPFSDGPSLLYALRGDPNLCAICALFLLQMPLSEPEAAAALAPAGIAALIEGGLMRRESGSVRALFRIIPVLNTFVVCDLKVFGRELPQDIVMGASI